MLNLNIDPKLVEYNLFKFLMENPDAITDLNINIDTVKNHNDNTYFLALIISSFIKETNEKIKLIVENTNTKKNYKDILKKCKDLALELNLSNSLKVSNLYTYLLWNGYFSKNKELIYQTHSRLLLPGMYSRDIMDGKGVCLNFSDMLTDFINEFDQYSSATLINNINKRNKNYYKVNIERKKGKEKIYSKLLLPIIIQKAKKSGTHAYNLINENGKLYIYDSTNLSISKLDNKFKSSLLPGEGTSDIKPYFSYCFNNNDKSDKILDLLHTTETFETPYNSEDFITSWEECLELFKDNINLLDDFYSEINSSIVNICDDNIISKKLIKNYKVKSK